VAVHEPTVPDTGLERVADAVADLYQELFGELPSAAKAYADDDLIVCVLRGGLTPIERTLLTDGQRPAMRELRTAFHDAVADRFIETVERITDRTVLAFMSQAHINPDLVVEVFVLDEPLPAE
jgi:uncharacterized protein YbcI